MATAISVRCSFSRRRSIPSPPAILSTGAARPRAPCWPVRACVPFSLLGCLAAIRGGTEGIYQLGKGDVCLAQRLYYISTRKEQRLIFTLEPIRTQLLQAGTESDLRLGPEGAMAAGIPCLWNPGQLPGLGVEEVGRLPLQSLYRGLCLWVKTRMGWKDGSVGNLSAR